MTTTTPDVADQLQAMKDSFSRRSFYVVALSSVHASRAPDVLLAHLGWLKAQEAQGTIVMSGLRFATDGAPVDGLTVLRAGSFEDAVAVVETDPAVIAGAPYLMHRWDVAAGAPSPGVRLSEGQGGLG